MTTQHNKAALLPCPFCGSTEIFIEPDERGSGGQWVAPAHVGCARCLAEQCADDKADAIAAWNKRTPPAPAEPQGQAVSDDQIWAMYMAMLNSVQYFGKEAAIQRARTFLAAPPPQQPAQGWQPIATVSEGNLVVVYWEDPTDPANPERYDFDYLEDGTWMNHHDRYEHMCIAGGHGLKEAAPYTHWMALGTPAMTAAQDAAQGGGNG